MYEFSIRDVDDIESLVIRETQVISETRVTESIYAKQSAMPAMHGCFPIGLCNCTDESFTGWSFKTCNISGARALINVGIVAIPMDTFTVGDHVAVRYTVSGRNATVWICSNQKPGVILAHAMHNIVKYCDKRIERDIRRRTDRNVELLQITPDLDPLGRALQTRPLKRLN